MACAPATRPRCWWRRAAEAQWRITACAAITTSSIASLFFLQAEDGIRDRLVTGVQTCALPISKLYVPLTRMDLVEKYRGAGESGPPLDKLGGSTSTQRKTRVKSKMRDMADELLKLYAERRMTEGFAFSRDSNWQREFEDSFEFTETKDQISATKEIKRDLESPHPMDRLLCGDVGFGKTEVAMRAAFK